MNDQRELKCHIQCLHAHPVGLFLKLLRVGCGLWFGGEGYVFFFRVWRSIVEMGRKLDL